MTEAFVKQTELSNIIFVRANYLVYNVKVYTMVAATTFEPKLCSGLKSALILLYFGGPHPR